MFAPSFQKINKAYKVLTKKKRRLEYDYLRDHPDEYISRYGSNVFYKYAPKSDASFVALFLFVIFNIFTWFAQKSKWQKVADHVVKLALEGAGLNDGGTVECVEVREKAMEIFAEKKNKELQVAGEKGSSPSKNSKSPSKKKGKAAKKEQKEQEAEELRPIIVELVKEIKDFGAGFHQPTYHDLLITKVFIWPIVLVKATVWQVGYLSRRLRKLELSQEELTVLTRRAMGEVSWASLSDVEQHEATTQELWISSNLEDWRELQEVKKMGTGHQKRYARWKKKQGSKLE